MHLQTNSIERKRRKRSLSFSINSVGKVELTRKGRSDGASRKERLSHHTIYLWAVRTKNESTKGSESTSAKDSTDRLVNSGTGTEESTGTKANSGKKVPPS